VSPSGAALPVPAARRGLRPVLVLLAAVLVAVAMTAISVGAFPVGLEKQMSIIFDALGGVGWADTTAAEEGVIRNIRVPRVVLAMLVGANLALGGAVMQGLFRNPLADPGLIGISGGAAVAAVAAIVLGAPAFLGAWGVPLAAFLGALVATLAVFVIGTRGGVTVVMVMLLAGIGINALAQSMTGVFVYMSDELQLREFTFWTMGSLGGANWAALELTGPIFLIPLVLLPFSARSLNAIVLGEKEARHLGVEIQRLKLAAIVLTALGVGVATAMTGIIGFVGIVVPHIVRLAIGADHRLLLPACIFVGAGFLVVADLFARTVIIPAELPIGVVTAAVGAPFFLWLIVKRYGRGNG
jgi:iron complex transport system permease protein